MFTMVGFTVLSGILGTAENPQQTDADEIQTGEWIYVDGEKVLLSDLDKINEEKQTTSTEEVTTLDLLFLMMAIIMALFILMVVLDVGRY
jgi:hypothetical protein